MLSFSLPLFSAQIIEANILFTEKYFEKELNF